MNLDVFAYAVALRALPEVAGEDRSEKETREERQDWLKDQLQGLPIHGDIHLGRKEELVFEVTSHFARAVEFVGDTTNGALSALGDTVVRAMKEVLSALPKKGQVVDAV